MPIRVTAWGEHRHQKKNAEVAEIYQGRIHEAIAGQLAQTLGSIISIGSRPMSGSENQ
jgi:trehalose utilization protein